MNVPRILGLPVTYRCDGRCAMCSIWLKQKGAPELSLPKMEELFSGPLLSENAARLILTGGEPTMREDLAEIARCAVENLRALEEVALISNGLNPERVARQIERLLDVFPEKMRVNFGFSLDGAGATHDLVRGVEGAFERTMRSFREAKALVDGMPNRTASLGMTISRLNCREAREVYLLAKSEGVRVSFTTANVVDVYLDNAERAEGFALGEDERGEAAEFFDWLEEREPNFYNRMASRMLRGEARPAGCLARNGAALVDVDGSVYPCGQSRRMCFGNVHEEPFEEIWGGERARRVRDKIAAAECPRCMTNCYPEEEKSCAKPGKNTQETAAGGR